LTPENKRQLFIPRGFAHGFLVLSSEAIFTYKVDNLYSPQHERSICFNDPAIGIDWGIDADRLLLSEKDKSSAKLLCEAEVL
jgi:dTDP-4-dehydrorhamnose 3,5-epimerase